jgi:hypothetical protein
MDIMTPKRLRSDTPAGMEEQIARNNEFDDAPVSMQNAVPDLYPEVSDSTAHCLQRLTSRTGLIACCCLHH